MFSGQRQKFSLNEAQEAWDNGQPVFIATLAEGPFAAPGKAMAEWADIIASIEAIGWKLQHWHVTQSSAGVVAYPLFRRGR